MTVNRSDGFVTGDSRVGRSRGVAAEGWEVLNGSSSTPWLWGSPSASSLSVMLWESAETAALCHQAGLQKLQSLFFEHSNMNSSCQNPHL